MAKNAMEAANQQLYSSGFLKFVPGVMMSLQAQFNVGHKYVGKKLMIVVCPFVKSDKLSTCGESGGGGVMNMGPRNSINPWNNGPTDGCSPSAAAMQNVQVQQRPVDAGGLKTNVEEPDLYLPSMAIITYVLLYVMQRGMLAEGDLGPEVFSSAFSFAFILLILEVGGAKLGFYLAGSPMNVLDVVSNCGYKYVNVDLMLLVRIGLGQNKVYWFFFAYFAAAAAFVVRRLLLTIEPSGVQAQYGMARSALHGHIILGLAVAQVPLCWLLTPSYH